MKKPFKLKVNEQVDFEISAAQVSELDFVKENETTFHIIKNNKSYRAEVVELDFAKKIFSLKINGNPYQIQLEDEFDQLVNQLGLSVVSSQKVADVKAPMPGLVLEVAAEIGQEVKKGDPLLILEAMKMENVIKSIGEGKVKAIHIKQGEALEKGQLMIEME